MSSEYKINDHVRYSVNGICLISDIANIDLAGGHSKKKYYILKPISNPSSTVYVPADNEKLTSKMERVLDKSEVDELIMSGKTSSILWVENRNERSELFNTILTECNQCEMLKLISCILVKKQELKAKGKKMSSSDEDILKRAEKLIANEFSYILGIPSDDVGEYIKKLVAED